MKEGKRRRLSMARLVGLALVLAAYTVALLWAADISAVERASADPAAQVVAVAVVEEAVAMDDATAAMEEAGREAPLATLAIAGGMLLAGGGWYAVHAVRSRHPLAHRARMVVRYISTLV